MNQQTERKSEVQQPPSYTMPISSAALKEIFSDCYDFEMRDVNVGGGERRLKLCFIDGLVSGDAVGETIIRPLADHVRMKPFATTRELIDGLMEGAAYAYTVRLRTKTDDLLKDLLNGYTALLFDKEHIAVTYETKSGEKRSIGEPKEEKVIKGAKDAFIEILKSNTSLIRLKLRNPNLKIKETKIGAQTDTTAAVVYIKGYTDEALVRRVEKRLESIRSDGILSTGSLEEFLVDTPSSLFPQLLTTERPDRFCMNLLEGRVGILVDGLPIGLLAPGTFAQYFKVPEDKASHYIAGSLMTILRYMAFLITLFLPAFYVGVVMYHQEMLPTKLVQSIIQAKQSVPFPTAVEIVMMLLAFELLQEAGLRLPNSIGQTVSIIGALIVGQSAVEARVVSPVVVIVVALAGIAGYVMPDQDMGTAVRIIRFLLVLAVIATGMFGLAMGCIVLVYRLCSLECFGIAYMSPLADSVGKRAFRAFVRLPAKKSLAKEPSLMPDKEEEK